MSHTLGPIQDILGIALDAAPWLLLGLLAAGLVKAFIPERQLQRWLGGRGLAPIMRAAVIGAPLPLCSCGAIPTALILHRGGAGRGPTTAFLIATPGIGVDSLAITHALLGPYMAISRALGAIVTAVVTGMLVGASRSDTRSQQVAEGPNTCGSCCANGCASTPPGPVPAMPLRARIASGLRYAFNDVLDDIAPWLFVGLVIAGLVIGLVPPASLSHYGSGLAIMLIMAVVGMPMYICATAATPIAVAMILTGVSPGAALVFLLAGPITSMPTLAVLRREMGSQALLRYVIGILASVITLGLMLDYMLTAFAIDVAAQMDLAGELMPSAAEWLALALLVTLSLAPLRRQLLRAWEFFQKRERTTISRNM